MGGSGSGRRAAFALLALLLPPRPSRALPRGCSDWLAVWYAHPMREEYYVTSELLGGISVRQHLHRPLREAAERALRGVVPAAPWDAPAEERGGTFPAAGPWRGPRHELREAMAAAARAEEPSLQDCTAAVVRLRQSPGCGAAAALARGFRAWGLRHFFVLLGEERGSCGSCPEFFDRAPLVVRNYFHADCAEHGPRVFFAPMGLQRPPPEGLRRGGGPASARSLAWSFVSAHATADRGVFVRRFAGLREWREGEYLLSYPGNDPDYLANLCDSKFALCPRGNHEDTWRLHEALYCGAIPVVTDGGEYFKRYLPPALAAAFVTVGADLSAASVRAALREVGGLLGDAARLDARQRELRARAEEYRSAWLPELRERVRRAGGGGRREEAEEEL